MSLRAPNTSANRNLHQKTSHKKQNKKAFLQASKRKLLHQEEANQQTGKWSVCGLEFRNSKEAGSSMGDNPVTTRWQWAAEKEDRDYSGHGSSISCYMGDSPCLHHTPHPALPPRSPPTTPSPATNGLLKGVTGEEDPKKGPVSWSAIQAGGRSKKWGLKFYCNYDIKYAVYMCLCRGISIYKIGIVCIPFCINAWLANSNRFFTDVVRYKLSLQLN